MAKRKFSKSAFREWLDTLAKVVVKTRDEFTCQINHDEDCSGTMTPLDNNCQWCHIKSKKSYNFRWELLDALCGCGHCHAWAHANPNEFGVWFAKKYSRRNEYLNIPRDNRTWRECDFWDVEAFLLQKCIDLNVDVLNVPDRGGWKFRAKFLRRVDEFKHEALKEQND